MRFPVSPPTAEQLELARTLHAHMLSLGPVESACAELRVFGGKPNLWHIAMAEQQLIISDLERRSTLVPTATTAAVASHSRSRRATRPPIITAGEGSWSLCTRLTHEHEPEPAMAPWMPREFAVVEGGRASDGVWIAPLLAATLGRMTHSAHPRYDVVPLQAATVHRASQAISPTEISAYIPQSSLLAP